MEILADLRETAPPFDHVAKSSSVMKVERIGQEQFTALLKDHRRPLLSKAASYLRRGSLCDAVLEGCPYARSNFARLQR